MKKLLISISVLTAAIFALVSCEQTSYIYEPTNECLTFSSNGGSWLFTDEPVIEFDLVRGVINTDLTVQLNLGGDGLFSLETPAQVHFAPGESAATVRVGYDADRPKRASPTVSPFRSTRRRFRPLAGTFSPVP